MIFFFHLNFLENKVDIFLIFSQHWNLNLSASSVRMKMAPLFTITSHMEHGTMVFTESMEGLLMDTIFLTTPAMETKEMRTVMKRIPKMKEGPAAEAVVTYSHCPSGLILFLYRYNSSEFIFHKMFLIKLL